jgi:hypothetical protein
LGTILKAFRDKKGLFLRRQSLLAEFFFESREILFRRLAEAILHAPGLVAVV